MIFGYVLLALVTLPTVALLLAPWLVQAFYAQPEPKDPPAWPRVSVLKPVKGLDPASEAGFRSFIDQDYPDLEVIFAVEGFDDPVLPLIEQLRAEHPDRVRLVHSTARADVMGKANNVLAAQAAATGQVYVSADSDVIAGARDVRRLVGALYHRRSGSSRSVGAAGALPVYRGMEDFGAGLMGAYYSPFMLILYSLKNVFGPRDVFPGTYYAILPEALRAAGGWERISDNIADDSTMGRYLWLAGFESVMTHVMGSVPEPRKSLREWWSHQHRWNLTYRATLPLGVYILEPFIHPMILALALPFVLPALGFAPGVGWLALGGYVVARWLVIGVLNLGFLKEPALWRWLWVMPISEILLTGAWFRSLVQPVTVWRGVPYRVSRGGKLVRL